MAITEGWALFINSNKLLLYRVWKIIGYGVMMPNMCP